MVAKTTGKKPSTFLTSWVLYFISGYSTPEMANLRFGSFCSTGYRTEGFAHRTHGRMSFDRENLHLIARSCCCFEVG